MNMIVLIGFSIGIGALIGGMTNLLAIRMLFRPLQPIRWGSWQIPFTPGLIPKRRAEIARNVGQIVEQHLLTSSALQDMLRTQKLETRLLSWLREQKERVFHPELTLRDGLDQLGVDTGPVVQRVRDEFAERVYVQIKVWILSADWQDKVQETLEYELKRGWLGSIVSGILPTGKLIEKLRALLLDWLYTEQAKSFILEKIGRGIEDELDTRLDQPVATWLGEWEADIDRLITQLGQRLYRQLEANLEQIIAELPLAKMVEDQINSFSLVKLESLAYQLAKRELKWITLLGALVGGLVGLCQGLLYLMFVAL